MIKRQVVTKLLSGKATGNQKIVCCLGRAARDMYEYCSDENKYDIFYCVGAMGSVLPFSLGIAMARSDIKIWAVEGDGSIIMNLGALLTYKRHITSNLTLILLDNKQYETTGGQKSQPDDLSLEDVCHSMGLKTITIKNDGELEPFFTEHQRSAKHHVVIIETAPDEVSPRISELPSHLMHGFKNKLT